MFETTNQESKVKWLVVTPSSVEITTARDSSLPDEDD